MRKGSKAWIAMICASLPFYVAMHTQNYGLSK